MKPASYLVILFVLMAGAQLFVPSQMIWEHGNVLENGRAFKFQTAPVDPNDAFRGKYIRLNFKANSYLVSSHEAWQANQVVYVAVSTDKNGFAEVLGIYKNPPGFTEDYFKASIEYISQDTTARAYFKYPFDIFYMEESKAPKAETIYNETFHDSTQHSYALVRIKDGESTLENVFINDSTLVDVINHRR